MGPIQGVGVDANKITLTGILFGYSGFITEAGLFSGNTLFSRVVLDTPFTVASDQAIEATWTVTFQRI